MGKTLLVHLPLPNWASVRELTTRLLLHSGERCGGPHMEKGKKREKQSRMRAEEIVPH